MVLNIKYLIMIIICKKLNLFLETLYVNCYQKIMRNMEKNLILKPIIQVI